ncbi:zinc dependent phospholipase C family protein [Streptomyces sp. NPDC093510]|uniref:zinc dependent phospholipase C family protein n=1 Tax=Streptomyces sp. NPDC093510 TaxID=3155199 RepID=UPI00343A2223
MPGIPSHLLIADLATESLADAGQQQLRRIIVDHPEVYHLGAIGPDLCFFAPDFGDASLELVRIVATLYDEIVGPIVDLYEKYVRPIVDLVESIEEGVEQVLDEATCGLVGQLDAEREQVSARVKAIAQQGLGAMLVKAVNVFDLMTPPIQEGDRVENWFWFDTLHNRRTAAMLQEMWSRAESDAQRAYVLGYASHYAGDFFGHQFVNTVVGSPARARLQRHHFAENMIDTHLYDQLLGEEVSGAKVHLRLPHGQDVEDEPSLLALIDRVNDIPDDMREIFELIADSKRAAFAAPIPHPRRISSEFLAEQELNTAFWLLLASMRASTSTFIPPPEPPSATESFEEALDAIQEFLDTLSNPPQPPGGVPDVCIALFDDNCDFSLDALEDWAEAMADALGYGLDLLEWGTKLIADAWEAAACTLTAPIKTGVRAGYYLVHLALHDILERAREIMVQAAISYPTRQWVASSPLAASFLTVAPHHVEESRAGRYPRRAASSNAGFQSYPATEVELPATWSSSYGFGTPVDAMVSGTPLNEALLQEFGALERPEQSIDLAAQSHAEPLGSAVPFTTWVQLRLFDGTTGLPDLGLDADRGYGHRNWEMEEGHETSVMHNSDDPVVYRWSE